MHDILRTVHAHMPYHLLPQYLDMILAKKINPEIYFNHVVLDALDKKECLMTAGKLLDAGLKVTFHAPFVDLRPGALDSSIRRASLNRLRQVFDLAPVFHPLKIVCHPCFDERYYVDCDDLWLRQSHKTWSDLIESARNARTLIALENVYEKEPAILRRLFEMLDSEYVCFCFDTGHFNAFARAPLATWMAELGPYIGHLHLHDNFGQFDEHLPVGAATFPFEQLFAALREMSAKPTITLEAHQPDHLWASVERIQQLNLLKGIL
ncbi:MAG: TIM barrel protein [Smithellaceae bacterium]